MKNLFLSVLVLLSLGLSAQQTSRLIPTQAKPYKTSVNPDNLLYTDTLPGGDTRIWAVDKNKIKINPIQIEWLNDSILVVTSRKFVKVDSIYNNPSFIGSLDYSTKITNKPAIPSAQVNSDWNSSSGVAMILNKPDLNLYYLASNPNGYISSVPAQSFSSLTGKPTTLSGYGITDGVPSSRSITINGVAFDLSANRSWTVGDVTSASLATTLGGYATSSALTSGLASKQNTLSLTTTGSGAATLSGSILNIPTPVVNTYTAGSGIGIAGNVISNSSPDQVVSISSGTGISVTGSYPSFVATNTAPYVAPVISTPTMVLGTTYQAPANKNVWVNASVTHSIALTLLLSSGSSLVQLQTSPNGTTWTTINSAGFSDAVAVAVALTKTVTNNVSGEVDRGYYYRLLATTSGAGSAAITNQQLKTY